MLLTGRRLAEADIPLQVPTITGKTFAELRIYVGCSGGSKTESP